ncbi:hypothetical protein EDD85DRAFT_271667 [Armillaria nabsnona]|nr:hypothetical protein EDD85DRAFT_271667 [Armillaria nabsnona]
MKKTSAVSVMVCWFQAPLEILQLVPCHANVLPDPAIAIPTFEIVCSTDGSDPMLTIFVVFMLIAGPGTLNSVTWYTVKNVDDLEPSLTKYSTA